MEKFKKSPKYNVVSMRINDEEKLVLEEMTKVSRMSISRLMREVVLQYFPMVSTLRQADIQIPAL